jgi:hypothetical protein
MKRIVKAPEDLNALLKKTTGSLADFSTKAKSLNILTDIVAQICPDLPEDSWQIANFRDDCVVIEAKSSVWGQRLQFERYNIVQQLVTQTKGSITKIEIKINPYANRREIKKTPIKAQKQMSKFAADHINSVAENAPPGLKEKLLKLAKHVNKY